MTKPYALPSNFAGGLFVAAGDVNGDGIADVIVGAGTGGWPQVTVFSGKDFSLLKSFYAMPPGFAGGVRVAAGDMNGDGKADIVVGAGGCGSPEHARLVRARVDDSVRKEERDVTGLFKGYVMLEPKAGWSYLRSILADDATFRGPLAGRALSNAPLPTDIAPDKHVLWKTELPLGHSSPAIIGNKIFLTAVRDKEHLETLCLERSTGKILWRVEVHSGQLNLRVGTLV